MFVVGKNQAHNQELVERASPNDWWIHADDAPSAHGIVPATPRFPRKVAKQCCLEIKRQTPGLRKRHKVQFIVTKAKHISSTDVPGQVVVHRVLRKLTL